MFMMMELVFLTGFYYDPNVNNMNVKLEDITVELGEKLPSEVTSNLGLLVNEKNLAIESNVPMDEDGNTKKIGKYSYYLVYNDDEFKISRFTKYKANVTVIDTTKPIIKVNDDIEIEYDSDFSMSDIATCIDLSSCKMSIEEEIDTTESGEYEVNIIAIDEGNNINYAKANIKVLEKPTPKQTVFYSNYSINIERNNELNASMTDDEKNNLRNEIVEFAKQFVGNPYVYGGTSLTNGTDCSGFTMSVYANFGYSLPRSSGEYPYVGTYVSSGEALPGDIVVYNGHVGLYAGNGMMVHASTPQGGIKYAPVYDEYHIFRRVIY